MWDDNPADNYGPRIIGTSTAYDIEYSKVQDDIPGPPEPPPDKVKQIG